VHYDLSRACSVSLTKPRQTSVVDIRCDGGMSCNIPMLHADRHTQRAQQGVALTGRNRTGPPWSVGRPTGDAAGVPTAHAPGGRPARPPAALQTPTDDDDRRQRAKQYWPIRRASNKPTIEPSDFNGQLKIRLQTAQYAEYSEMHKMPCKHTEIEEKSSRVCPLTRAVVFHLAPNMLLSVRSMALNTLSCLLRQQLQSRRSSVRRKKQFPASLDGHCRHR